MIPTRFGAPPRQLFGLYQPPAPGTDRSHGVVVCNPFGQEAIRCHRLLRVLADRLARNGFAVLRFDYSATGDSDGDDEEADLERWVEDVLSADEEVRRASGHASSSWFGLRLGATLAALASARARAAPRNLVLWDPVVDGAAYLAELAAAHAAALRISEPWIANHPDAARGEALGFPIPATLAARVLAITPAAFANARAAHVDVVASARSPGLAALAGSLAPPASETRIASQVAWATDEAMNSAIVPADALEGVAAAIARPA